jgi:hypothetical protein
MSAKSPRITPLAVGLMIAIVVAGWQLFRLQSIEVTPDIRAASHTDPSSNATTPSPTELTEQQKKIADQKIKALLQRRLDQKGARAHEAVLTFETEEAYRKFLARAGQTGLKLRGKIDRLRTVRVGYESLDFLFNDMMGHPSDYQGVDANYLVKVPGIPEAEDRAKVNEVPFGDRTLAFLGVTGDHSQWGRGVTVAVLDTGVAADATLSGGRIQYLDAGQGSMPGTLQTDGHGTAVAALVAGASADAPGVASAANILSIRITGVDGTSDSFTLAMGILDAVDAGARIINISMGAYASPEVLINAIDYAYAKGAVIVAAAGNDGAAQLMWPAADPRVVSVGAIDALEQQVSFSNAGAQLKITAPGYGVDTAWLNGQRVSISGTSASAPLVAGAIAAVMSTSPGLTAPQAWAVVQQYTSDGGTPGADAAYGNGILNIGWTMDRANPTRIDTAIAGQYYDATTGTMDIVVQNRSAQTATGLQLNLDISGSVTSKAVPSLNSGATYLVQVPISTEQLAATGGIFYRSQLANPTGIIDQVPANNAKSGVILAPVK